MKRGLILFLVFIFSISIFLITVSFLNNPEEPKAGDTITGEAVTGEVTNANLGITISLVGSPILTIIKPLNQTYFENESLKLKVNTNTNDMWYNLDNGANITFTDDVLFNTSEGSHTIYVFSNNSFGTTTKNITFTVNNTLYEIIHDEYKYANRGDSTNFSEFSFTEIQNLSNIILENSVYGKIIFNEAINVTNDQNTSDDETNLDTNINISSNRIELNSAALPNFNVPATLHLYNLTFSNPRILKDNSVCSSLICTQESYSGGTLKFNVTGFTIYSAEETPGESVSEPVSTPGPAQSGGSITVPFTLSGNEITFSLKRGEVKTQQIRVTNNLNKKISITIDNSLKDFLIISENSFDLIPKGSKVITINAIAKEETIPSLYLGKLNFKGEGLNQEVLISIEIESKDVLFDVKASLERRFIKLGEKLHSTISIFNIAETEEVDVIVEYKITDGVIFFEEKEIITINKQKEYKKVFEIPEYVMEGKYVFFVTVTYDGKTAVSSSVFEIKEKILIYDILTIAIILIVLFSLIAIIKEIRKIKKYKNLIYKIKGKVK